MPQSLVPDDIRKAYLENVLSLKTEGKSVPDLVYDGVSYFADNKGEKWGGWRLRNRASHSAQGSKRRAKMRGAVASEDLYIEAFGEKIGKQRYLEDKGELKRIWGTRGKAGFDIDHIYPLAAGGQETPRNLMLREASANRGKGAKPPTPEQRAALLLSDDPLTQIQLQGPQPTARKRAEILNLINEGGTVRFKPSGGVKLGAALSAVPVINFIFDAGDVQAGVQGYTQEGQTPLQQFGSGLQALSGTTGLAAMVPTPASPALGAVSTVSGFGATAVQSGAVEKVMDATPAALKKAQQLERILNPVGALITNELKFIGGQVRMGKIPYFN
jgi:hypothetical protein